MEDNQQSPMQYIHSIYHTFLFFGLIDVLILKIYFNKSDSNNLKDHISLALFIYISNLLNHYFLYYYDLCLFKNFFYYLELIFLSLQMVQVLFGFVMYNKLKMTKKFERFSGFKVFHQFNAFFIIILGKVKMIKTWSIYVKPEFVFDYAVILYVFFFFGSYLIVYNIMKRRAESDITEFQILNENNREYWNLKKSIENDEFVSNNSSRLKSSYSDREESIYNDNQYKTPKINWFIFENKFYDLKDFNHPGGNFILEKILQKDITKIIYGKSSIFYYDEKRRKIQILKHKHSYRAFDVLKQICIAPLKIERVLKEDNNQNLTIQIEDNRSLDLFDSKLHKIYNKFKTEVITDFQFSIFDGFQFFDDVCFLLISSNINKEQTHLVYLNNFWVNITGRYFMLFSENSQKEFLWSLLSYNPTYLRIKKIYLKKLSEDIFNLFEKFDNILLKTLEKILDYEKDHFMSYFYPVGGKFKTIDKNRKKTVAKNKYFFEEQDNELFGKGESDQRTINEKASLKIPTELPHLKIEQNQEFQFKGPLGKGLKINSYTTGKFLLLIKNEGIFPFLDFLEILIQRTLLKLFPNNPSDWIFNSEYNLIYVNGVEIDIFWIVDDKAVSFATFFGLPQLELLVTLQNKINDPLFKIIQNVVVRNTKIDRSFYECIDFDDKESLDGLEEILHQEKGYDRILISACEKFKKFISEKVCFKENIAKKITFLT